MKIIDFVPGNGVVLPLGAVDAPGVLHELASALAAVHGLDPKRTEALLVERESLGSTAIGNGVAVPHAKMDVATSLGVVGLRPGGIDFQASDRIPIEIFVAMVSPQRGNAHLKVLASVSRTFGDASFCRKVLAAKSADDVYRLLMTVGPDVRSAHG